jgi:hypothetical protein
LVYKGININDYKLYTEIMDVASHAYAIVREE